MEEQEMPGSGDVSSPGLRPGYGKPRSIRLPTEVDEWVERYMKETHLAFTAVVKQALYELRKREGRN